jgi:hypothetical protein
LKAFKNEGDHQKDEKEEREDEKKSSGSQRRIPFNEIFKNNYRGKITLSQLTNFWTTLISSNLLDSCKKVTQESDRDAGKAL